MSSLTFNSQIIIVVVVVVLVLLKEECQAFEPTVAPRGEYAYVYGRWSNCVNCERKRIATCFDNIREVPAHESNCKEATDATVQICCTASPTSVTRRRVVLTGRHLVAKVWWALSLSVLGCIFIYAAAILYKLFLRYGKTKREETKYSRVNDHDTSHSIELPRPSNSSNAGEENEESSSSIADQNNSLDTPLSITRRRQQQLITFSV